MVRFLPLAFLLSGCQMVVVRWHGDAMEAPVKTCYVADDNPNAIDCFNYFNNPAGPIQTVKM